MEAKPAIQSSVEMTELVLPSHTNHLGTAFGGVIMSWIDICAAISAQRHARRIAVTASIDMVHFISPVLQGHVVSLKAQVNRAWRTSMEVGVRVETEDALTGDRHHAATAFLTYVALDADHRPTEVPPVICATPDEERRYTEAEERRAVRLMERNAPRD
jgi:acyl-CoA hydrolase